MPEKPVLTTEAITREALRLKLLCQHGAWEAYRLSDTPGVYVSRCMRCGGTKYKAMDDSNILRALRKWGRL